MRVLIITQNEPFYLLDNLKYLFENFPEHSKILGCVINRLSPFGKTESFLNKVIKTIRIFGLRFFFYYSIKYFKNNFGSEKKIIKLLEKYNIKNIKLNNDINHPESLKYIDKINPDLIISILGSQIFSKKLIKIPPKGCINLHSSLLPKYRGMMPIFWAMKNNEKYSGVSVFFMDDKIDNGPILIQKRLHLENLTLEQLIIKAKKVGMEAIIESINLIKFGQYSLIENNYTKRTYFSFPKKKDVKIFLRLGKKFF